MQRMLLHIALKPLTQIYNIVRKVEKRVVSLYHVFSLLISSFYIVNVYYVFQLQNMVRVRLRTK